MYLSEKSSKNIFLSLCKKLDIVAHMQSDWLSLYFLLGEVLFFLFLSS